MVKECIPPLTENTVYSQWKKEIGLWQLATSLPKNKQAPNVVLSMVGKPRHIATQLDFEELTSDDGIKKLLSRLDKYYQKDRNQIFFHAMYCLEKFNRPKNMQIDEYVSEFSRLVGIVKECRGNDPYEDGVLAYRLLQQASLTEDQQMIMKATQADITFEKMVEIMKRTFGDGLVRSISGQSCISTGSYTYVPEPVESNTVIKAEPVFYQQQSTYINPLDHQPEYMEMDHQNVEPYCEDVVIHNGAYYQKMSQGNESYHRGNFSPRFNSGYRSGSYYRPYGQQHNFCSDHRPGETKWKACHICGEEDHLVKDCKFNAFKNGQAKPTY